MNSEIVKLTIKIDSNLSQKNLCFPLKLPIPIMQRMKSQTPE